MPMQLKAGLSHSCVDRLLGQHCLRDACRALALQQICTRSCRMTRVTSSRTVELDRAAGNPLLVRALRGSRPGSLHAVPPDYISGRVSSHRTLPKLV